MAAPTTTQRIPGYGGVVQRTKCVITCDAGGDADVTTNELIGGSLVCVQIESTTDDPYTILCFDEEGQELFGSAGTITNSLIPKRFVPTVAMGDSVVPVVLNEQLRFVVTYGGNAQVITVVLYHR